MTSLVEMRELWGYDGAECRCHWGWKTQSTIILCRQGSGSVVCFLSRWLMTRWPLISLYVGIFCLHGIVPEGPESVLDIRHRLCRAIRSVASNPQNNNGKRKRAPHSTVSEANSAYIRSSCCVQCSLKSISAAYLHKICSTAFGVTFAASHFSYLEHHGSTLHHNQR
jgi:hypothetical protein